MIHIDIDDRAVLAVIADLARRAADTRPAMADIAQALESETEHRLEREGPGWPALAAATVLKRTRSGHWPGKRLQVSAALAREIDSGFDAASAWIGAGGAASRDYAAIHQLGGEAGRGKKVTIPARPYLPMDDGRLTDDAQAAILEILQAHLAG